MNPAVATVVGVVLLLGVLAFAIVRPRGLPEAVAAVPAAVLALAFGLISPADAAGSVRSLAPTIGFLAAVLVIAELLEADGVFRWLGGVLADRSAGRPGRLLVLVFATASITTAVLSLDATVVLLTPVILTTVRRLGVRGAPHVYATAHLSNSASLLLPVSNLTNLLAFHASGLTFLGFAALMAGPWLVCIGVEYGVFRIFFRTELAETPTAGSTSAEPTAETTTAETSSAEATSAEPTSAEPTSAEPTSAEPTSAEPTSAEPTSAEPTSAEPTRAETSSNPSTSRPESTARRRAPRTSLILLGLILLGLVAAPAVNLESWVIAAAGAAVLAVRAMALGQVSLLRVLQDTNPLFLLFVAALGVVVDAATSHGLQDTLAALLPTGSSLTSLLALTVIAAVLANLINNLPATLVLLAALGTSPAVGAVLAVLIGVNVGPNLTYTGSLATLLWRRVLHAKGHRPSLGRFTVLGLLTVPACLLLGTAVLWSALMAL